jgi:hypothetical protein
MKGVTYMEGLGLSLQNGVVDPVSVNSGPDQNPEHK